MVDSWAWEQKARNISAAIGGINVDTGQGFRPWQMWAIATSTVFFVCSTVKGREPSYGQLGRGLRGFRSISTLTAWPKVPHCIGRRPDPR